MKSRLIVILLCVLFVLVLIAFKINEYKRMYVFQLAVWNKVVAIENNQQKILSILKAGPQPQKVQRPEMPTEDPNKIYTIDLTGAPLKGDPEATVTIVEFSDIQCPFSQRFHPVFAEAVEAYPTGVNYVFKNFPLSFHPEAKPAIKALLAAKEQGKYWEMLEFLMQNGKELSAEKYKELAGQLELDLVKFENDLKEKESEYEALIQKDVEQAASANVRGTPTFYINGKKTSARTVEDIKKEIDSLLEKK